MESPAAIIKNLIDLCVVENDRPQSRPEKSAKWKIWLASVVSIVLFDVFPTNIPFVSIELIPTLSAMELTDDQALAYVSQLIAGGLDIDDQSKNIEPGRQSSSKVQ